MSGWRASPPYGTIVADPPWIVPRKIAAKHNPSGSTSQPRHMPYSLMTVDDIAALDVMTLADDELCHLYLWTINRHVDSAYQVARAWGFTPACLLVWTKTPQGLGPGGRFSITTEFILFARRGVEPRQRVVPTTWFDWPRTKQHSEKPAAFYDMVEQVSPGPYLELFARQPRLGWDSWGYGYEVDA